MPTIPQALQFDQRTGEYYVRLKFGAGLNTESDVGSIDLRECADRSQNFELSRSRDVLRVRNAIDLVGTATNAAEIRGFVEFIKSDGTISILVQAGGTVYSFDGVSTFTEVATVNSGSKLRGGRYSTSEIDDQVVITDLAKLTPVKKYDGTTFTDLAHNLSGDLFAKYALVMHERLFLANVTSNNTAAAHVLLGSGYGSSFSASDFENFSTSGRPASGATAADPFYLPIADMKAINGLFDAFGKVGISTRNGRIWYLSGQDKTDFALTGLYFASAAAGDEAIVNAGNDVIYGRLGRIESLAATDQFAETAADDISRFIADDIEGVKTWQAIYSPLENKVYFWPEGGTAVWVLDKQAIELSDLSPWSKWVTAIGSANFRTTAVALIRRPTDGKDVVWMGGPAGQIYELEGVGAQDAGSSDIVARRVTGLIEPPSGGVFDVRGSIHYKSGFSGTVTLTFEYGGVTLKDQAIAVNLPSDRAGSVWGGSNYWSDSTTSWWGLQFENRLALQEFRAAGKSNHMQVNVAYTGNAGFEIQEIEIRFKAAA